MLKKSTDKAAGRFTLLLLDEGEYYFEDLAAFYYPPSSDPQQAVKKRVKGRLNLCSGSLIFDPDDTRLPITKFPYRLVELVKEYKGPVVAQLPTKADMFALRSKGTTRMKENNINAPYVQTTEVEEHLFSLTYVAASSFLPRVINLMDIARLSNTAAEQRLRSVIEARESSIPFDKSHIVDFTEKILHETTVSKITPLVNNPGRLLITNTIIYFQPFNNISVQPVEKYRIDAIVRVVKRRYVLRHVGLEIFMINDESVFFAFKDQELRDTIYGTLIAQPQITNLKLDDQANVTLKWQNGLVSNYDYIMYLNSIAGRTFNDITQYPVFPWVIADYTSNQLNLNDPSTFRDLSKPIGALSPERLAMFVERMKQMPEPKFLYGTHYSTPGYVLFYLVRAAPEYMLRLQNGKFDAPNRMFHSIAETWTGVLSNAADVKELIPEFYSGDGSFLLNTERLYLGKKENGQTLDDVVLPPWAQDAKSFIEKCREALESDYVSENIHHWVDLIFGHQQQGEEAIKAHNLFYHLTYEGAVDIDKLQDPMEKAAIIAQIKEFGQTPRQLFTKPHPQRLPKGLRSSIVLPASSATTVELPEINITAEPLETLIIKPLFDTWGSLEGLEYDYSFKLHKDVITSACLSADGTTLFTVSQDSSLKVYSVTEKKQLRSTNISEMALSSCQLAPDEKTVIVGSWDNNIYLYSVNFGSVIDTISAHDDAVSCLCLRKDILISGSWDATVKVWQFKGNALARVPLAEFVDHETEVHSVDVDSLCQIAASGAADGTLSLYDLKTKSHIRTLQPHHETIHSIQFTPDGTRIVTCSSDNTVKVLELAGTEIFSVDLRDTMKCLRTDGDNLLLGGSDGVLRIWTLRTGSELKQIKGSSDAVDAIAVSKEGSTVVTGASNSIRVYKRKARTNEE